MTAPALATPALADVEILGPGSETIREYRLRAGGPETDQGLVSLAVQHRAFRGLPYEYLLPLLDASEVAYLAVRLGIGSDPDAIAEREEAGRLADAGYQAACADEPDAPYADVENGPSPLDVPDDEDLAGDFGRCDTCGVPCDEHGCIADRSHAHAIDPFASEGA
jgi:hypothetical protein